MIYCLTSQLYDDIQYLNSHKSRFIYEDGLWEYLDMFGGIEGHYHYIDIIVDAAKKIKPNNHLVTRLVYNLPNSNNILSHQISPGLGYVNKTEIYQNGCVYAYTYIYAYLNTEKLYIKRINAFPGFDFEDGERKFYSTGRKIRSTIEEIAKSTNKEHITSLLPPNQNMFSPQEVDYVIPTHLLR